MPTFDNVVRPRRRQFLITPVRGKIRRVRAFCSLTGLTERRRSADGILMLRPWGEWESLSRALGGVGHAVRACGSLQHAFRLQESGRLDEALAEAKSVLSLVRKSRRGSVTRGSGTGGSAARLSGGGKGSEILVLGALVIDELATAIGRPHQARSALEEALLVIEEERDAPRATDVEAHRYPFEAFETFLRSRLFELRALGQAKLN